MLKKLILAAGVAIVGVIIHKVFKNARSETLVDDACETMSDILKEECSLGVKEKLVDKAKDIRDVGCEIINGLSNPDICGDSIRMTASLIEDDHKKSFIDTQFKYNALYRNFMTAGGAVIVGGLFVGITLLGIGIKFREIGNVSYEYDLAIYRRQDL